MEPEPMLAPTASRPYMPGYGIAGAHEGTGLLRWAWAEARLAASHDYWLATVSPGGLPHLMPVWAMWHEASLWFSSSCGSRKARNLAADPRCSISTDNPAEPVVVEGIAELVTDLEVLRVILDLENEKYTTDYGMDMFDPAANACFRIRPTWAFAIAEGDFSGSPTRWTFDEPA